MGERGSWVAKRGEGRPRFNTLSRVSRVQYQLSKPLPGPPNGITKTQSVMNLHTSNDERTRAFTSLRLSEDFFARSENDETRAEREVLDALPVKPERPAPILEETRLDDAAEATKEIQQPIEPAQAAQPQTTPAVAAELPAQPDREERAVPDKRQFIIRELLETEKSYARALQRCIEVYLRPLLPLSERQKPCTCSRCVFLRAQC
jgi:hypothetical protein